MNLASDKKPLVLLGVTGCIAAYKSCEIVRGLQKAGVDVKVVMTEHATEFISPLTFRALTKHEVSIGLFDSPMDPIHHISLAEECDLMLIAPCTANVLAKIAHGIADDLLTTTALALQAPLYIAPAMNVHMFENEATQSNIESLRSRGVNFIDPANGELACGDVGRGKLASVDEIVNVTLSALSRIDHLGKDDLQGKKVVITAGPTVEKIDPVRYISNPSSGTFGFEIAKAAANRGADVTLVTGPVNLSDPKNVDVIRVETACDMLNAVRDPFMKSDIAIFSAAVSDMRPKNPADHKLKKGIDDELLSTIELVENPDIVATLTHEFLDGVDDKFVVAFAAETDDVLLNAKKKLSSKGAKMIVANDVKDGKAFGKSSDKVTFVYADTEKELPELPKSEIANLILDEALKSI